MTQLADVVRVTFQDRMPSAFDNYPEADLGWTTWKALQREGELTAATHGPDEAEGWHWQGSLPDKIRAVASIFVTEAQVAAARQFLAETGNVICITPRGTRSTYFIRGGWQDVSPAALAQLDRLAAERAEREAARRQAASSLEAPGVSLPLPEDVSPADIGIIGPDQFSLECRWCGEAARLQHPRALHDLRVHERERHPDEYWAVTAYVCPSGMPGGRCEFGASDPALFAVHQVRLHGNTTEASRDGVTAQAKALAAELRPAASRPALAAVPAQPAPAPPAAAGVLSRAAAREAARALAEYVDAGADQGETDDLLAELERTREDRDLWRRRYEEATERLEIIRTHLG
jgi:hypothetical protein